MKSLRLDEPLFSVRDSTNEKIEIENISLHHTGEILIKTSLGDSSINQLYKWGSNQSRLDIINIFDTLKEYFEKKIYNLQYYSNHKTILKPVYVCHGMYTRELHFLINGNKTQSFIFRMTEHNIVEYKKEVMMFLSGLEYGLIINGRQKHEEQK